MQSEKREAKIGSYIITDERLGEGGMGIVYRATRVYGNIDRRTPAACKVIRAELVGRVEFQQWFVGEAFLAMRLSHPNLVQVWDCQHVDGQMYLMMECCDGLSLQDLILRHGPLPEEVVAHVVYSIAEALAYLHEEGIVHGDVAPPNILISKDGRVKLSDFGLARVQGNHHSSHGFKGRLEFACPGLLQTGRRSTASDLWALLATAFYSVGGYFPYGPDESDNGANGNERSRFDAVLTRIAAREIIEIETSSMFQELLADLLLFHTTQRRFKAASDLAMFIRQDSNVRPLRCNELGQLVTSTPENVELRKVRTALRRRCSPAMDTVTDGIRHRLKSRIFKIGRFSVFFSICISAVIIVNGVFDRSIDRDRQVGVRMDRIEAVKGDFDGACYMDLADSFQVETELPSETAKNIDADAKPTKPSKRRKRSQKPINRNRRSKGGVIVLRPTKIPYPGDDQ